MCAIKFRKDYRQLQAGKTRTSSDSHVQWDGNTGGASRRHQNSPVQVMVKDVSGPVQHRLGMGWHEAGPSNSQEVRLLTKGVGWKGVGSI